MGTIESKPAFVRALFAYAMKLEFNAAKNGRSGSCLSFLFRSVRKALGGKVNKILSGAAPLPGHVHEFLVSTMGAEVFEVRHFTSNSVDPAPGFVAAGLGGRRSNKAATVTAPNTTFPQPFLVGLRNDRELRKRHAAAAGRVSLRPRGPADANGRH
jgi:hypothetical protein